MLYPAVERGRAWESLASDRNPLPFRYGEAQVVHQQTGSWYPETDFQQNYTTTLQFQQ